MKSFLSLSLIMLLGVCAHVQAQFDVEASVELPEKTVTHSRDDGTINAVTIDGRRVWLNTDNTWEFVQSAPEDPATSAVLSVTKIWEMDQACKLQFRLQNNLGYRISAYVARMSVQNQDGVIYDTKSISFASIKPTDDQYTELQFSGIGCHAISHLKVFDAARCRMGKIDQWNEEEGECLSHLYIEPSDKINISK